MATTITLELGPRDWDPQISAWRCPTAKLPGVKVAEVYANGRRLSETDIEVNKDLGVVRWRAADPPEALTIALSSDVMLGLSDQADTDRWKRLAIILPFVTGIVGALVPVFLWFANIVVAPSAAELEWAAGAESMALQEYKKGGDATRLTGQWLVTLYDVVDGNPVPYKVGDQTLAAETALIKGTGSLLTAVTGDTTRKGGIWATGRVSPGNWVTMTVWSDRTDLVSVNLLKIAPDRQSMHGYRIGIDGNGNVRHGEIEYKKLPE